MDRRVKKTRQSLVTALQVLLQQQAWDDINIQMICDQADIARSTFYVHFTTKNELLDLAFSRLEQELTIQSNTRGLDAHHSFQFLPPLLEHLKGHRDIMRRNEASGAGRILFNKFRHVASKVAAAEIESSKTFHHLSNDEIIFLFGGVFAMIEDWNNRHCSVAIQETLSRLDTRVLSFARPASR